MTSNNPSSDNQSIKDNPAGNFTRLLPPLPVFILQPLLNHIVKTIAGRHPELFARLGDSCKKRFLIDPYNLPIFLLLQPDPDRPQLRAYNRGKDVDHDVYISGTFKTLLRMIDGQTDSDALFFNRQLKVTGNSEAVVALRNALDNMDATLAEDVASCFGPLSKPVRLLIDRIIKPGKTSP
ncbi:MAG: sterol-binding protein [Hyphomicrobiales bacterium]|nr:sterol-binding protein [Hyphomicrobiales bacterium]